MRSSREADASGREMSSTRAPTGTERLNRSRRRTPPARRVTSRQAIAVGRRTRTARADQSASGVELVID
jgi:hypothetical protein